MTIHRTDGSGDTFIFTQYLSASDPEWEKSLELRNDDQLAVCRWRDRRRGQSRRGGRDEERALFDRLCRHQLQDRDRKQFARRSGAGESRRQVRAADAESVKAAANDLSGKTPVDESMSLIFAAGDASYPIVNYEYAIVNAKQSDAKMGREIKAFLSWTILPDARRRGALPRSGQLRGSAAGRREAQPGADRQDRRGIDP